MNLEEAVRGAVSFRDSLFVITGPLFTSEMPSMPKADESRKVPSGYFKIVYDRSGTAAAFLMSQSAGRNDDYCQKTVSLGGLQGRVTFDLPELEINSGTYVRLGC